MKYYFGIIGYTDKSPISLTTSPSSVWNIITVPTLYNHEYSCVTSLHAVLQWLRCDALRLMQPLRYTSKFSLISMTPHFLLFLIKNQSALWPS